MPIYEYHCKDCEQVFEEWQKSYDVETADCPVCGGASERIISNTSFVLKGGGWYVSEYGKNSASSSKPKSESPAAKAASAPADSGAAASGDSA